jgi:hypothetical protein
MDTTPADVTIYYRLQHPFLKATFEVLKGEVSSILSPMERHFDWRQIGRFNDGHFSREIVVVTFIGRCDPSAQLSGHLDIRMLGWTHISDGQILPFSDIDCDRIHQLINPELSAFPIEYQEAALGRAVGRVVAHELYHVFAQTTRHESDGVSKSSFAARELVAESMRIEISALRENNSPAAGDKTSVLDTGRTVFAQRGCSVCHGLEGEIIVSGSAASEHRKLNILSLTAKLGDKTTRMFKTANRWKLIWQPFSQAEIRSLVEYLNNRHLHPGQRVNGATFRGR